MIYYSIKQHNQTNNKAKEVDILQHKPRQHDKFVLFGHHRSNLEMNSVWFEVKKVENNLE